MKIAYCQIFSKTIVDSCGLVINVDSKMHGEFSNVIMYFIN